MRCGFLAMGINGAGLSLGVQVHFHIEARILQIGNAMAKPFLKVFEGLVHFLQAGLFHLRALGFFIVLGQLKTEDDC